jgi:hypothetical protein
VKAPAHACDGCSKLEARVAEIEAMLARIGQAFGVTSAGPYSSRRGCGPAGVSEERWKKIAKEIGRKLPGARWYIVERDVYEKWLAQQEGRAAPSAPETRWTPARALALAGVRGTR